MKTTTSLIIISALAAMLVVGQASAQSGGAHSVLQPSDAHQGAAGTHGSGGAAESGSVGELKRAISFEVGQRNIKTILIDDADVWIGSSAGAVRYDTQRGSYLTYDNRTGLLSNGVFHLSKIDDEIWVGTYGGGLSIFNPSSETWRNYNIPNGMGDAFVYDALKTRSGDVWIATWSGANRIRDGKIDDIGAWDLFTVENTGGGLPNDWVYGLAEGVNGEIWLATEGGLARFKDDTWTHWTHADGLGAPLELVEGDITFRNDPGQFSSHHVRQKEEQGLGDVKVAYNPNYVVALTVAENGDVWVGTWGAGLSRFDGETWQTLTTADGLPGNHVFSLHADESGRIWIGTNRGLAILEDGEFSRFGHESGLNVQSIFAITTAGETAWVGGFGGITWFPNGLETTAASKQGG